MTETTPVEILDISNDDAVTRIQNLEAAITTAFIEREDEAASLIVSLIAKEHVLLLGPPGTAKSALANVLAGAVGGTHFTMLMTKFTTPEEVFGPISLKGLEQDKYRRVTAGYFPEATVTFMDEVFKANSSILNSLLSALNERVFDNGGIRQTIPLEVCIGASNELPESDALDALYDRFCLRHWVTPIRDRDNRKRLAMMTEPPAVGVRLQPGDLERLRELRKSVVVPEEVVEALLDICGKMAEEVGVVVSDRRIVKSMKIVRANAIRNGRMVADKADLMILAHSLWVEPEQAPKVFGIVADAASPVFADALRILDAATEAFSGIDFNQTGPDSITMLAEANVAIRAMLKEVRDLTTGDEAVDGVASKIEAMADQVARHVRSQIGGI